MRPLFTFSRSERLHLQKDFKRVFKTGRKIAHPAVFIYISPNGLPSGISRLGLVTSRKVGSAVERNLAKRRLREIFRLNKNGFASAVDIICVPRPGITSLAFAALEEAVLGSLAKAGIFNDNKPRPGR